MEFTYNITPWSGKGSYEFESGDFLNTLKIKCWNRKRAQAFFAFWLLILVPLIFNWLVIGQAKDAWTGFFMFSFVSGGFLSFFNMPTQETFQFRSSGIRWIKGAGSTTAGWTWSEIRKAEDKGSHVELTLLSGKREKFGQNSSYEARTFLLSEIESGRDSEQITGGIDSRLSCEQCGRARIGRVDCKCSGSEQGLNIHEQLSFPNEKSDDLQPLPKPLLDWLKCTPTDMDLDFRRKKVSLLIPGREAKSIPALSYLGGSIFGISFGGAFLADIITIPISYEVLMAGCLVGFFILFFNQRFGAETTCLRLDSEGWRFYRFNNGITFTNDNPSPSSTLERGFHDIVDFEASDEEIVAVTSSGEKLAVAGTGKQETTKEILTYLKQMAHHAHMTP